MTDGPLHSYLVTGTEKGTGQQRTIGIYSRNADSVLKSAEALGLVAPFKVRKVAAPYEEGSSSISSHASAESDAHR